MVNSLIKLNGFWSIFSKKIDATTFASIDSLLDKSKLR
jgi:hypothetical protein